MLHVTVGRENDAGRVVPAECIADDALLCPACRGESFLLLVLLEGEVRFSAGGRAYTAVAPCFVCFDETADPVFRRPARCRNYAVYFHPRFLNVNMTFARLRSPGYRETAAAHDMFLLRPFLEGPRVVPIPGGQQAAAERCCASLWAELRVQRDGYWSCRSRSYFMELIMLLERLCGRYDGTDGPSTPHARQARQAVMLIESHYAEELTLAEIGRRCGLSHTTLTAAMRAETGMTVMAYLYAYRTAVAKKLLEFTNIPLKEVAARCGFKTVPHFSRVIKARTGIAPAEFRRRAVQKRKEEIV